MLNIFDFVSLTYHLLSNNSQSGLNTEVALKNLRLPDKKDA